MRANQGAIQREEIRVSNQGAIQREENSVLNQGAVQGEEIRNLNQGAVQGEEIRALNQGAVQGREIRSLNQGAVQGREIRALNQEAVQGEKISVLNQGDEGLEGVETGFRHTDVPEQCEAIPGEVLEVPGAAHDEDVGEEVDLKEGGFTIELHPDGNPEEADHGLREVIL